MDNKPRILIAGIGGASLGTEILKCLAKAGRYSVFGCDISRLAYGHYGEGLEESFLVDRQTYFDSVLASCRGRAIKVIIPGGEEPLKYLNEERDRLAQEGMHLAANGSELIKLYSDKLATFGALARLGFDVPLTIAASSEADLDSMSYPCVIKPNEGSGGSSFVFLAEHRDEAVLYVNYLVKNGRRAIVQEYISEEEGEFTIGVLSLPNGKLAGSVALKRTFESKFSVLFKSSAGLISTGYSQGLIDDFPEVRAAAEKIALAIGSTGPINIQGRIRNGRLVPFEINARFSASTYLRALAGFNEIDIYIQYVINDLLMEIPPVKPGYYLRTLDQIFVPKDGILE